MKYLVFIYLLLLLLTACAQGDWQGDIVPNYNTPMPTLTPHYNRLG